MTCHWVACPETAGPEIIEFDDSPFGILLTGCSRFRPASAVTCPRSCCAGFDRRTRTSEDPTVRNGASHDDDADDRTDDRTKVEPFGPHPFVIDATSLLRPS